MDIAIQGFTEGRDYVETFDSPQITKEKITRKIVAKHLIGESLFNTILNMHGQSGLDASQCSFQAGIYDTITVVFLRNTSSAISFSSGDKVQNYSYSADANGAEHALEELTGYKMIWNHNLYECVKDGGSITTPIPWWVTQADDERNADGVKYVWADSQPTSAPEGYGWREVAHREKKADSFLFPDFVVHEQMYFKDEESAEKAVKRVGKLKAPGKTYGRSDDDKYWLITRSSVSNNNGVYVLQTDYQYAFGGWDEDLYE